MKDTDPDRRGELTDAQLDQLLAETNRELLEHVEATSDPARTLTAIMARNAEQARPARGIRRAAHGLSAGAAAALIMSDRMSDRIRAFASAAAVTSDSTASRAVIAFTAAAAALTVLALGTVAGWPMIATAAASAPGFAIAAATIRHGFASRQGRGRDPGQALAAIMRSRSGARAIVRILADRGNRDDGVMRVDRQALTMARDLACELARDGADVRDLIAVLDVAISLARRLDLTLMRVNELPDSYRRDEARASAIDLDRQLRRSLTAARRVGRALASVLDERQVDVSGADLSKMHLNPHLLNGAIWTHQTSWPPSVAGQVRAHSTEIRPDVYQVRLGSTPDRDFLALS